MGVLTTAEHEVVASFILFKKIADTRRAKHNSN